MPPHGRGLGRHGAWDKFEEHAKVAFVAGPHHTRFFVKSSYAKTKSSAKETNDGGAPVVQRLVACVTCSKVANAHSSRSNAMKTSIQIKTMDVSLMTRVLRLVRFGMQEVLGPMTTAKSVVLSPVMSPTHGTASASPPAAPLAGTTATASPAGSSSGAKSKKKKKRNEPWNTG